MPLIEAKDIHKTYAEGSRAVKVLRGVELTIEPGETVAIVGASGAGKSTLLNLLGTLDRPSSGELLFKGKDIFTFSDSGLAEFRNRSIGFVFQFHHLLPEFSALENVMLPALIGGTTRSEAEALSTALLEEVGLGQRLSHKPGELSGGEQQRSAIVRALVRTPELILADEPTGNLDAGTGAEVFELLLGLNKARKTTLIVVTHNQALANRMQRRLEMADGKLKEIRA